MSKTLQDIDQELRQTLQSRVISGLDAVRALAITLVLMDHFLFTDHLLGIHPKTGSLGVMIFFVLSGYLITAMLLKEYRKNSSISLSSFYRRRAYRIFPAFYCCWMLTTAVDYVAHQLQWKTAAVSFFYLMDYGRALAPENVQPYMHMWISWSLAVEEKFYLLWPLLLLFLLRRPRMIQTMAAIILGQWTYRAILSLGFHVSESYVYCTFDMRADALLVGCLLALVLTDDKLRLLCCRLLRWQWLSVLAPLALVWVALTPAHGLLVWSFEPVVVAVMLLQFIYWGARAWTICSNGMIKLLAHLSYGLYLYHPLAGKIVKLADRGHLGLYAVALTLVMAIASYYLIEQPFMRMRDEKPDVCHHPPKLRVPHSSHKTA